MSDIERLAADLRTKDELRGRILHNGASIDSIVRAANENGYAVTRADADAWIAAQEAGELDDAALNAVAGGKTGHSYSGKEGDDMLKDIYKKKKH